MIWTERLIARHLACGFFKHQMLAICPNTYWTGFETDLLLVCKDLRLIDVEIKISRSDLKADAKKSKWWEPLSWPEKEAAGIEPGSKEWHEAGRPMEWPRKVWKHYYAMPRDIWTDDLFDVLPSAASGVILLQELPGMNGRVDCGYKRKAKPDKEAKPISAEAAVDIARLISLRMWDVFADQEREAA